MTDPIADMLSRLRNASLVHKNEVAVPYSKIKMEIARLLVRAGYLINVVKTGDERKPEITLSLKYEGRQPVFSHLRRISTPGHRRYVKTGEVGRVLNGFGLSIISTPKGVLTDAEARKAGVGGEIICEVY